MFTCVYIYIYIHTHIYQPAVAEGDELLRDFGVQPRHAERGSRAPRLPVQSKRLMLIPVSVKKTFLQVRLA